MLRRTMASFTVGRRLVQDLVVRPCVYFITYPFVLRVYLLYPCWVCVADLGQTDFSGCFFYPDVQSPKSCFL